MIKTFTLTLLLTVTLFLIGCSRGPAPDQLRRDVQTRLDGVFGEGLLQVYNFRRYGSQPLSSGAADDQQRVGIYYRTELELLRGHRFSEWSGQSIGALHQALGSAVKGVDGITATGNKPGDILLAHGLSVYVEEDSEWLAIPFQSEISAGDQLGGKAGVVAEIDSENALAQDQQAIWHQNIIRQLQLLNNDLSRLQNTVDSATLRSELQTVLTRAKLKQMYSATQPVLLGGAAGGNYHALAQGLEKALPSLGDSIKVVSSSGAIENLRLLQDNLAAFAFTQSDLAASSFSGNGVFSGQRNKQLRALAALYPEPVQIVVRRDSGINTIADLVGKRVNIGPDGTGTAINAKQILALADIDYTGFTRMDFSTSVTELNANQLDALFITGALPSRYLSGMSEQVKLLALDAEIIDQLEAQHGYVLHQIRPNAYPGLKHAITTVAVTAVLVANERASNKHILALLKALYDAPSTLSEFSGRAGSLDPNYALEGIAIPLHLTASKYWRDRSARL